MSNEKIRFSDGSEVAAKRCVACGNLIAATSFRCEFCESNQPRVEVSSSSSLTNRGATMLAALAGKIAAEKRAAERAQKIAALEAGDDDGAGCPECADGDYAEGDCPACIADAASAAAESKWDARHDDGEDDIRDASEDGADLERGE